MLLFDNGYCGRVCLALLGWFCGPRRLRCAMLDNAPTMRRMGWARAQGNQTVFPASPV